ncbi:hypothetical protein DACRYDRAFT_119561 [Dacryopinax primogenitus]|uniref:RING-type domain-containing protein n=1 Tax=Dacryopinax primogenitus (strain DJM 731) TaxID=1858805 RepID=M5FZX7_DACPD|nr:uncharacterized protein DACRYDRAFT_119561 [Dacryopinax primogenitus]EJT97067.1 hypothetical protein DACRYDRAFT_119561 [Dacryopinax primogenitus]
MAQQLHPQQQQQPAQIQPEGGNTEQNVEPAMEESTDVPSTITPIPQPTPASPLVTAPAPEPNMPGALPTAPAAEQPPPQPTQEGTAHIHAWQIPGGMVFTLFVGPSVPIPGMATAPPTFNPFPIPGAAPGAEAGLGGGAGEWFIPFFPPWFFPQEKEPDYARGALLMRALEQVEPELLSRFQRVQGEDQRCPVCFERLGDAPAVDPPAQDSQAPAQAQARQNHIPPCPFPQAEILALPCHHPFHAGCLFPWLGEHTTCPTCRFDLDPESQTLTPPPQGGRYSPYLSQEARKAGKWNLPLGPSGQILRESVVMREHEQGWTCADPGCLHALPNPSYAQHPAGEPKALQIHLLTQLDPDAEPACEHAWHPECLVGSVRSRAGGVEVAPGGTRVECALCRDGREGWVMRDVWEDGVRAWEEV